MTLSQISRNLKSIDISRVAIDSIKATADNIADLNVLQMNRGLRNDGSEITPEYAPLTVQAKQRKGQPTDRVTLRDTGDFNAAMFTKVEGNEIITGSNDFKSDFLEKRYDGPASIFGLSDKYKQNYIDDNLRPTFLVNVQSEIFK